MKQWHNNTEGLSLLLIVVIVGSAALIMALSTTLLGIGELDLGVTSQKSAETFALTDGCVEEALRRLRLDSGYAGGSLSYGAGTCIIGVQSNLQNRIITATGTVDIYTRVVQMDVDIDADGVIVVNNWNEL